MKIAFYGSSLLSSYWNGAATYYRGILKALAERGYDRLYGARPLGRVIQEFIKKPLAEELLFGRLVKGGAVKVALKDGALDFAFTEAAAAASKEGDGDEGGIEREPETVE